jgi:RimJ/RimL family protein N-acetyltransferase
MPPPVIEAGPLTLRPFGEDDIAWVCQVSQDPAIQANLPQVFAPYRREHAAFFVRQMTLAAWDTRSRAEFLVAETPAGGAAGTRLGRVGLGLRPHDPGAAEIGYWMDPRARGRGVATAAVRALCQWAFTALDLALIEWHAEVGNVASRRVAEKAGFLIGGTLRRRLIHREERVDAWVGSLLRPGLA